MARPKLGADEKLVITTGLIHPTTRREAEEMAAATDETLSSVIRQAIEAGLPLLRERYRAPIEEHRAAQSRAAAKKPKRPVVSLKTVRDALAANGLKLEGNIVKGRRWRDSPPVSSGGTCISTTAAVNLKPLLLSAA